MPDRNWSAERVRANFRLDAFSGLMAGVYIGVIAAFLPVVVRRMGGSTTDVALVVAGPFIGHLFSPVFGYLLARFAPVRITAVTAVAGRLVFLIGVLVVTTPFALALVSVTMWVISIANMASYATLMQGIYPDSERASAMGKVRVGVSIASIASATLAGLFIDQVSATIVFAVAAAIAIPGGIAFGRIRHDPLLVDHFNAPNSFVGYMTALQWGAAIIAYYAWGKIIDRGSSLRLTVLNTALVLLMPLGYLLAPNMYFLLPVAIVAGVTNAGGDITFFTNVVQLAPRDRIGDYAVAQSSLMGVRGTIAPFAAAAFLSEYAPQTVMIVAMGFMVIGLVIMDRVVRGVAAPAPLLEVVPA